MERLQTEEETESINKLIPFAEREADHTTNLIAFNDSIDEKAFWNKQYCFSMDRLTREAGLRV